MTDNGKKGNGKKRRKRATQRTHPKTLARQNKFLEAFREIGTIRRAAEAVSMPRHWHYDWLKLATTDKDGRTYQDRFDEAYERTVDDLEGEARRRAVEGVEVPVFQKGQEVGAITRYSDVLLMFLLNGARPEKYKHRQYVETEDKTPKAPLDLKGLTDTQLEQVRKTVNILRDAEHKREQSKRMGTGGNGRAREA